MAFVLRAVLRRPGALIVLGSSVLGGAAYRFAVPPPAPASLDPHTFTPYTLVDKQPVSRTGAIFTLRSRDGASTPESMKEAWKRAVWSVQIKQPQLQIARAYTPLPPVAGSHDDAEPQDIRLLIRQEEGGEVSTYLHRLPEQSTIEIRGPSITCELPDEITEVIFLAGGTGIAPAMQVAHALRSRPGTKMHILWANRKREECLGGVSDEVDANQVPLKPSGWRQRIFGTDTPAIAAQEIVMGVHHKSHDKGVIVQELDALKKRNTAQSGSLDVHYYMDDEKKFIKPDDVAKRLGQPVSGSRVILISGPDGFIEYWAGKKVWIGGREEQGPLGGVLSRMDLKGWSVFKL